MTSVSRAVVAMAAFFAIAGCAGGAAVAPQAAPAVVGASVETISDSDLPQGFPSAAAITAARRVTLSVPTAVRQPAMDFGPTFNDTAGWKTSGAGSYTGVFGFHSAYVDDVPLTALGEIGVGPPAIIIEAPVTRAPGGSCYEVESLYAVSPSGPTHALQVNNLCGGAPNVRVPIDAAFVHQYVRQTATLPPSYAFAIVTFDRIPSTRSTWYVALYDFLTRSFDVVASESGLGSDPTAASEYRYGNGENTGGSAACNADDQPIVASGLTFFRPTLFAFDPVRPTMPGLTTSLETPAPNGCFGQGDYVFDLVVPDAQWEVRDLHGEPD